MAAELSFGVCRWYRRLDALVAQLLRKPLKNRDRDLQVLLLVGAYQLLYSRMPPHAAISTAVEASRRLGKAWASKLINGVLRRLQRDHEGLAAAVDRNEAIRYALPDWLYDAICTAWPEQRSAILPALQARPPMVLRVDLSQTTRGEYLRQLVATGVAGRGLDVASCRCVVNFAAPNHLEAYVHQCGRTGRAGAGGGDRRLFPRPAGARLAACGA